MASVGSKCISIIEKTRDLLFFSSARDVILVSSGSLKQESRLHRGDALRFRSGQAPDVENSSISLQTPSLCGESFFTVNPE